jgi:hypothetical protein
LKQEQVNALRLKVAKERDEVLLRPFKAINAPSHVHSIQRQYLPPAGSSDQPVVVGVRADSEPRNGVIVQSANCAPVNTDADGVDFFAAMNSLEIQTRMAGALSPSRIGSGCKPPDALGQIVETLPKLGRRA